MTGITNNRKKFYYNKLTSNQGVIKKPQEKTWGAFKKIIARITKVAPGSMTYGSCMVDEKWIKEQKAKHVPTKDAPYISTNDILTSWFFTETKCTEGSLVVNSR